MVYHSLNLQVVTEINVFLICAMSLQKFLKCTSYLSIISFIFHILGITAKSICRRFISYIITISKDILVKLYANFSRNIHFKCKFVFFLKKSMTSCIRFNICVKYAFKTTQKKFRNGN